MKKKISIVATIIIAIGLLLLIGSLFIRYNKPKNTKEENKKIVVDTSKITGDQIDNTNYDLFDDSTTLKKVKIRDKNVQYTFLSPKETYEYYLDDYSKHLQSKHLYVEAYTISQFEFDQFNQALKNRFEDNYNKFNYSYNDKIKINNYNAMYIKHTAYSENMEINDENRKLAYEEKFAIVVDLEDNYFILIYNYKYRKTNDDMLSELINGIEISKKIDIPVNNEVKDDYIEGIIKQNKNNEYEHGYEVSYKASSEEFKIDEYKRNNISSTYLINNDQTILLSYELFMTYDNDAKPEIIYQIKEKNKNNEIINHQETEKTYEDKTLIKISFSYNDKISETTKYYIGFIEKIENNFAILTSVVSENELDDNTLNNYLNYIIKEY